MGPKGDFDPFLRYTTQPYVIKAYFKLIWFHLDTIKDKQAMTGARHVSVTPN